MVAGVDEGEIAGAMDLRRIEPLGDRLSEGSGLFIQVGDDVSHASAKKRYSATGCDRLALSDPDSPADFAHQQAFTSVHAVAPGMAVAAAEISLCRSGVMNGTLGIYSSAG